MPTTIHAGVPWVAGLQAAANTAKTAQQVTQDRERHELDQDALRANIQRVEAITDAEKIENQIRLDEQARLRRQASIDEYLVEGLMDPQGFGRDPVLDYPEMFKGARPDQMRALGEVAALGREITAQTQEAQYLGNIIQQELRDYQVGNGPKMPGYDQELQKIGQALAQWQPGSGIAPAEFGAQVQALREQNNAFQVRQDAIDAGLKEVDEWNLGADAAPARAMMRQGDFDAARQYLFKTKFPTAHQRTREEAQEELISQTRGRVNEEIYRTLNRTEGLEPGTKEYTDARNALVREARAIYGEEVVPLSEQEQAQRVVATWDRMLRREGLSDAEVKKAIAGGADGVERALLAAAKRKKQGGKAAAVSPPRPRGRSAAPSAQPAVGPPVMPSPQMPAAAPGSAGSPPG